MGNSKLEDRFHNAKAFLQALEDPDQTLSMNDAQACVSALDFCTELSDIADSRTCHTYRQLSEALFYFVNKRTVNRTLASGLLGIDPILYYKYSDCEFHFSIAEFANACNNLELTLQLQRCTSDPQKQPRKKIWDLVRDLLFG